MKSIGGALFVTILLLVGVSAMSCKGKSNPVDPGAGADEVIQIVGNAGGNSYAPGPDTVLVGMKVSWHNSDIMTHTATSDAGGVFNTGDIGAGQTSVPIQMNTAGAFRYHCSRHPSMFDTLRVL